MPTAEITLTTVADRERPQRAAAARDELEALLGGPRAALLRALDEPLSAGQLAERLGQVPSGISHHLAVLEPAGLVARRRQGQSVVVHRTARGSRLLALYARVSLDGA